MSETTVIVRSGDTLWALAEQHLGNSLRWPILWRMNANCILAEQKRRGLRPCHPEDWIFPGMVLRLQ